MIHQPLGGYRGQATDIEIHAKETRLIRDKLDTILATHTGRTPVEIHRDTERDNFMGPQEAIDYGLVDSMLSARSDIAE